MPYAERLGYAVKGAAGYAAEKVSEQAHIAVVELTKEQLQALQKAAAENGQTVLDFAMSLTLTQILFYKIVRPF